MGFFPYMGEILWVFLTFMEVFPIPPLSSRYDSQPRGRSGGGWGIYVAVVIIKDFFITFLKFEGLYQTIPNSELNYSELFFSELPEYSNHLSHNRHLLLAFLDDDRLHGGIGWLQRTRSLF